MKITYQRIQNFRMAASNYLNMNKGPETKKLNYALQKMISRTNEFEKKIQEDVEDKRIELASEDEHKNVIVEGGQYKFTKENQKTLTVFLRDVLKREFEVEPYMVKDIGPVALTFPQIETFTGFILEEQNEPETPALNTEPSKPNG